jgi:hypothetical protein
MLGLRALVSHPAGSRGRQKGRTTMVTKISIAVVVALVAFLAAPTASFAASKKSQADQQSQAVERGPYTPDIKTKPHGASRDFQGGSIYYKRSKTKKTS